MMIRRTFAGSIVALLLSVSPLAAACDLSCAFAAMKSDCHSQQTESQDLASGMAMAGMTMPEMAQSENQLPVTALSQTKSIHPSIGEMGPCERQACDSNSAVSAKTTRSVDSHFHFIPAVTETSRASDGISLFHGARDSIATFHVRDGSPLHLSLRV
jgi:hypothetical protein